MSSNESTPGGTVSNPACSDCYEQVVRDRSNVPHANLREVTFKLIGAGWAAQRVSVYVCLECGSRIRHTVSNTAPRPRWIIVA